MLLKLVVGSMGLHMDPHLGFRNHRLTVYIRSKMFQTAGKNTRSGERRWNRACRLLDTVVPAALEESCLNSRNCGLADCWILSSLLLWRSSAWHRRRRPWTQRGDCGCQRARCTPSLHPRSCEWVLFWLCVELRRFTWASGVQGS